MLITLAILGVMLERTIYYTLNEAGIIEDENAVERIQRIAPHEARRLGLNTDKTAPVAKPESDETKLATAVQNIKETLSVLDSPYETANINELAQATHALRKNLDALNKKITQNFADTQTHIEEKNLPDIIMQRHTDTVAFYDEKMQTLKHKLLAIDLATTQTDKKTKLEDAKEWLSGEQFKRQQQTFDPNNLPFKKAKPNPENKPKITEESFAKNGYFNTPTTKLAALGDFTYSNLPDGDNPAYLASSDEITLSQAIKDKAEELNYNTVEIYHWVRNNIQWQPTWGAVQNAELTLDAKRGNAMDIASLTLALLRASQIPARYVHGTIDIPEAQFRNWTGGFTSINAAATFASAGGIPITTITRAGQIHRIRMEHIWVEVATDYLPSRAAKNIDADSWIQIDPSYKQYNYLQGLDVVQLSGIDTDQLAQDVLNSGTVNEQEGWITGFDPTILQTAQTQAQTALEDHINTLTDPTVGDVIGGRKTIVEQYPVLAASLPNKIVVTGTRYDKLPNTLQQSVTYRFSNNSPNNTGELAWATVNNEKVTLSFTPATADDEAALQSLLPEGDITDLSQLPTSIPGYLINVVPELKVNGEIKLTGNPIKLGEGLDFNTQIKQPGRSANINYTYNIPAGSFVSVNTISGNVSANKLTKLQTQLTQTKTTLETNDPTQIQNLTREEILGDMFYTGTLSYFAQFIGSTQITALQANEQFYLHAGYGTFGYEPNVAYFFGIPRDLQAGGVTLDIPTLLVTANNAGNSEQERQFVIQAGVLLSTLEHATPEQMFNTDPSNPPNAFSAVKALQIASAEGQRIYQINQANISTVMPSINLDTSTEAEIVAAVNAGKEVIAHTDPISVPGYTGAGYIILDTITGEGAYRISGGANGSFLDWWKENGLYVGLSVALLGFVTAVLVAAGTVIAASIIEAIVIMSVVVALINTVAIIDATMSCESEGLRAFGVAMEAVAVGISFAGPAGVAIATFLTTLAVNAMMAGAKASC